MRATPIRRLALAACLGTLFSAPASACSSEPYIGSVCMTAANFCPRGFAQAAGQILSIQSNTALFSLLGTTYGGNGQTTFALPDLRGRAPIGDGQGPGLSNINLGQVSGTENVTLTVAQLPAHSHAATVTVPATATNGNTDNPTNAIPARLPRSNIYSTAGSGETSLAGAAVNVGVSGSSQPVAIRNPYLGLRYCIALVGIYPPRD